MKKIIFVFSLSCMVSFLFAEPAFKNESRSFYELGYLTEEAQAEYLGIELQDYKTVTMSLTETQKNRTSVAILYSAISTTIKDVHKQIQSLRAYGFSDETIIRLLQAGGLSGDYASGIFIATLRIKQAWKLE